MKKHVLLMAGYFLVACVFSQIPGSLDPTFGNGGTVYVNMGTVGYCLSMARQNDQKLVMSGALINQNLPGFGLLRFNADGSPDNSFGTNGVAFNTQPGAPYIGKKVLIQPDGKILVLGLVFTNNSQSTQALAMSRYNSNGSLDLSFGTNGNITYDTEGMFSEIHTAALQPDGKIVTGGRMSGYWNGAYTARFNPDGSIDSTYNGTGFTLVENDLYSKINDLKILDDGNILAVGLSDTSGQQGNWDGGDLLLVRYHADGTPDLSFGINGKTITAIPGRSLEASSVDLQTDGKIVIGGNEYLAVSTARFLVTRYTADGTLDNTFGINGIQTTTFAGGNTLSTSMAVQPGGDIIVGGTTDVEGGCFALACYTPAGDLNTQFDADGKVETCFADSSDAINALLVLPDGKIIAGGHATVGGVVGFAMARYFTGNFLGVSGGTDESTTLSVITYPNPATEQINLQFYLDKEGPVSICITDMTGCILQQESTSCTYAEGNHVQSIQLAPSIPSGIYFLNLVTSDGFASTRWIKN